VPLSRRHLAFDLPPESVIEVVEAVSTDPVRTIGVREPGELGVGVVVEDMIAEVLPAKLAVVVVPLAACVGWP
jgi:hypothetical protein